MCELMNKCETNDEEKETSEHGVYMEAKQRETNEEATASEKNEVCTNTTYGRDVMNSMNRRPLLNMRKRNKKLRLSVDSHDECNEELVPFGMGAPNVYSIRTSNVDEGMECKNLVTSTAMSISCEAEDDWIKEINDVEQKVMKIKLCGPGKVQERSPAREHIKNIVQNAMSNSITRFNNKEHKRQAVYHALLRKGYTTTASTKLTTNNQREGKQQRAIVKENQHYQNGQASNKKDRLQDEGQESQQVGRITCARNCSILSEPGRHGKGEEDSSTGQVEKISDSQEASPRKITTKAKQQPSQQGRVNDSSGSIVIKKLQGNELVLTPDNKCQVPCYDSESSYAYPRITDGLPTITMKVKGCWYSAKLDTCAGYSIASSHMSKYGESSNEQNTVTHIEGVGGQHLPVVGIKKFKMETINGKILWVDMLLVKGIREDFLLGLNFFTEQNAVMDFEHRVLICGKPQATAIEIPFDCTREDGDSRVMQCSVIKGSVLPAETRGHTMLKVDCDDNTQIMFLPIDIESRGVMLAPTIAIVKDRKITIPVMNVTTRPVSLPNKQVLGTWIPLQKDMELLGCNNLLSPESLSDWFNTLNQTSSPIKGEDEVEMDNLNDHQRELLKKLLRCYPALVEKREGCPPLTRTGVEHVINTGSASPIFQKRLRHAVTETETIKTHVDKMLRDGVIEEGNGPWGFPVVLVKKKDGETRFCIDYRSLNEVTIKDVYPLPRIDETIENVGGARWFTTLDLKAGYWQLGVREQDKDKTAFVTRQGLFRFRRMPFGLCNAPGTFQRMMDCVLRGLLWVCCLVYLDDVIVYTRGTFEQHLLELATVFERLSTAGLTLKLSKCKFGAKELEFLGHLLTPEGIKPLDRIIEAVKHFPVPKDVDEARRFVHLAGYYRRFIPQYGTKLASITKLLRKSYGWEWGQVQQEAFDMMKKELTRKPLLAYPDFRKPFVLVTDASTIGIGAALMQDHGHGLQPIAYASKVNNPAQSQYSITKLECLAMVWAVKTFRPYLYGRKFTAITDHAALKWLMKSQSLTGMLHRWAITLQEYDFEIQFRPGTTNVVADALSRAPVEEADEVIYQAPKAWETSLQLKIQCKDTEKALRLRMVIQLSNDVISMAQRESKLCTRLQRAGVYMGMRIFEEDGLLKINTTDGNKIILPPALWPVAFKECHDSIWNGHLRLQKTLARLRQSYWWPNMERVTHAWVIMCQDCGSRKTRVKQVIPPLRPLGIGFVGERWVLDIAGPLPITQGGNRYVIAALDWVSKYAVGIAVPDKSALHIAKFLLTEVVFKFGPFRILMCDNAPEFIGKVIETLVDMLQARQHTPIPYRPNFVGLVERFNRTWKDMVAMYVSRDHNDWDYWLPMVLYAYNSAVQTSTNFQPAQLMMGRKLPMPSELLRIPTERIENVNEYHRDLLVSMRYNEQVAKNMIKRAQERQARQYNKQVRYKFNFKEGVMVWVHQPPRGQGTTKFKHQWRGPAKIVADVGYDNRRVIFLDDKQEIVAHVSQLVPYHHKDYLRIMTEFVNDWSDEKLSIENGNLADGISWIYDNQESIPQESSNMIQVSQEASEWNEMEIQSDHRTQNNQVFTETRRRFKRNPRTGRQEPWYEVEYIDEHNRKVKRWLNRVQYEDFWQNGWCDSDQCGSPEVIPAGTQEI